MQLKMRTVGSVPFQGCLNDNDKKYTHEHYYLTTMANRGRYLQGQKKQQIVYDPSCGSGLMDVVESKKTSEARATTCDSAAVSNVHKCKLAVMLFVIAILFFGSFSCGRWV